MKKRTEIIRVQVQLEGDDKVSAMGILQALVQQHGKEDAGDVKVVSYQARSLTQKYTVVGVFTENGERFARHAWAENAEAAESQVLGQVLSETASPVEVAGVFLGHIKAER